MSDATPVSDGRLDALIQSAAAERKAERAFWRDLFSPGGSIPLQGDDALERAACAARLVRKVTEEALAELEVGPLSMESLAAAETIRAAKAEAWDEGVRACAYEIHGDLCVEEDTGLAEKLTENPYRPKGLIQNERLPGKLGACTGCGAADGLEDYVWPDGTYGLACGPCRAAKERP